ncbi:MAG TPA: GtrA family protein [Bacillota bacterium]|nr:GtrA family protein [Bacillota bacterium]
MLSKLLMEQTDNTAIQLFRSLLVSFIAFAVDFSVLFGLTDIMHMHYLISASVAFLLGLGVNYFFSVKWVFNTQGNKKRFQFLIFSLIGIVGLGSNEVFIWIFTEKLHLHYLMSKVVSTAVVYFWNFFARKIILFKENQ